MLKREAGGTRTHDHEDVNLYSEPAVDPTSRLAAEVVCRTANWLKRFAFFRFNNQQSTTYTKKETAPEGIRHRSCERREGKWGGIRAEGRGGRGDLVRIMESGCANQNDSRWTTRVTWQPPSSWWPSSWQRTTDWPSGCEPSSRPFRSTRRSVESGW